MHTKTPIMISTIEKDVSVADFDEDQPYIIKEQSKNLDNSQISMFDNSVNDLI